MEWFQYKPGVVVDSLRVAHRAAAIPEADALQSRCRRKFHLRQVEETSAPDETSKPDKAGSCVPCFGCLLRSVGADDAAQDTVAGADQGSLDGA